MLVPLLTYPSVSPGGGQGACLTGPVFWGGWGYSLLFLKNGTLTRFVAVSGWMPWDSLWMLWNWFLHLLAPHVPDWPLSSAVAALVPLSVLSGHHCSLQAGLSWSQVQEGSLKQKDFVNGQGIKKDH